MPTEEEIKAQRIRFLNEEIKDLYGIRIIQCGRCSNIFAIPYDKQDDCICPSCLFKDDECYFPDLFY